MLLLCIAAAAPSRGAVPGSGLVGHWRFDAVRENRVADLSPSGHALLLESPATAREGESGASLVCDGFEVGGRVDEHAPLAFKSGLTLAIWVRPERSVSYEPLLGRPNPNPTWTTPLTGLYLSSARPVFGILPPNKKILVEGPELPLRAWSLVMVTADEKGIALWVNGAQVAEQHQALTFPAAGDMPWYVGRSATQFFRGRIGETLVWNRALNAEEIATVLADTAPRHPRVAADQTTTSQRRHDRYVEVESHGSVPDNTPWRKQATRTLAGLNGFTPTATPPGTDRWGGRTDRPAQKASGFFRTEQIGGRWWLITPEGHLFWNVGINAVQPPRGASESVRKAFGQTATRELRELGFNGLGNWSGGGMQAAANSLPWSIRLNFLASFAREHKQTYATAGHTGFTEQCIPVFHPEFPAWAREHAKSLAATADDAGVLGLFTDNELQCPVDMLDRNLRLPANDPYLRHGRAAALAWLAAEGRPADPAQLTLKDRYRFIAYAFATYGRIVHAAVREVDHHHLIFGPRFNVHRGQFDNPWFWPAVAPYLDVAAVNYYLLWGPQREQIQEWSDAMHRPVILTEWYSKALDAPGLSNTKGAGWLVRTQSDRAKYYQHFTLNAFETPGLVGFHYFKYLDDDSSSVALDSAGGANKGLYRADGSPWPELQEAARAVNRQVYPLIDFFDASK